ncbi:MAG: glycerophosphodiester phosphodiesterase family protein [Rubrimonas sp.]
MLRIALAAAVAATLAAPAFAASFNTLTGAAPIVIAHRGASGYLPEHTLGAYELAIKLGADFIEPDLQLTRDGQLVAMHDDTLNRTTNVASLFAPRNGGYRVEDFDLDEIRQLTVVPFGPQAGATFPGFTPSMPEPFRVPTFAEVLSFLNDYNAANGANIGIYPEAKTPNRALMNQQIVAELKAAGFTDAADRVYIQSFSFQALQDIAAIQAAEGTSMRQVALGVAIEAGGQFFLLDTTSFTPVALSAVAGFADGLGVTIGDLSAFGIVNALGEEWVSAAHALGLEVHAWTLRPLDQAQSDALTAMLLGYGIDGFFTDYTDRTVASIAALTPAPVPLPASAVLLLGGMAALGAMRRRRAAA